MAPTTVHRTATYSRKQDHMDRHREESRLLSGQPLRSVPMANVHEKNAEKLSGEPETISKNPMESLE